MFPNVWTAMGRHIVPGPSTPRQTGPRLRLPGPSRAPPRSHATHPHPGAATATRLPFLTPHDVPKRVDCHGAYYCSRFPHTPTNGTTAAAAATSSPYKHSCRKGQFSRKVPLDSFSMFSTNRIFFFFSTHHYLQAGHPLFYHGVERPFTIVVLVRFKNKENFYMGTFSNRIC